MARREVSRYSRGSRMSAIEPDSFESVSPFGAADPHVSPWPLRAKAARMLWGFVQATLFRCSFHNWYGWRRLLLRSFGAKVGATVRIRRSVRIEMPWNLVLGDACVVGDFAILYSLGVISVGRSATISQYAHLCAGTHDYARPGMPLLCPPIRIGDGAWIAADAFIGPGVTVGDHAVVGARSTVMRDVAAGVVVVGNPARFVKNRTRANGA